MGWIPFSGHMKRQQELDERHTQEMEMHLFCASEETSQEDHARPKKRARRME
jgi:hypothetical protein